MCAGWSFTIEKVVSKRWMCVTGALQESDYTVYFNNHVVCCVTFSVRISKFTNDSFSVIKSTGLNNSLNWFAILSESFGECGAVSHCHSVKYATSYEKNIKKQQQYTKVLYLFFA